MANRGVITASEFDALVARAYGRKYDRLNSYNGLAWSNGSGGTTTVYQDSYQIVINGTNLTASQVIDEIERRKRYAVYGYGG